MWALTRQHLQGRSGLSHAHGRIRRIRLDNCGIGPCAVQVNLRRKPGPHAHLHNAQHLGLQGQFVRQQALVESGFLPLDIGPSRQTGDRQTRRLQPVFAAQHSRRRRHFGLSQATAQIQIPVQRQGRPGIAGALIRLTAAAGLRAGFGAQQGTALRSRTA